MSGVRPYSFFIGMIPLFTCETKAREWYQEASGARLSVQVRWGEARRGEAGARKIGFGLLPSIVRRLNVCLGQGLGGLGARVANLNLDWKWLSLSWNKILQLVQPSQVLTPIPCHGLASERNPILVLLIALLSSLPSVMALSGIA